VSVNVFVNLTPHPVTIFDNGFSEHMDMILAVEPSGTVARLIETVRPDGSIDGMPAVSVALGEVSGLPEPQEGVTYIVSMPTLMGMRAAGNTRSDVRYPFDQVRDGNGRIIGCKGLATIA